MRTYFFAAAGLLVVVTAFATNAAPGEKNWRSYVDRADQVIVRFPATWRTSAAYKDRTYFEGVDGFFQLIPSEGDTPEQVCRGAAMHHLRPFGSHPQVRSMKIHGRRACLVWPSEDQGGPWDAEVVIQYPRDIKIEGRYGQLILNADKKHVLEIAKTLRFRGSK